MRATFTIDRPGPETVCDALAARTGLSKTRIKRAMVHGAVWLRRGGGKSSRIRRATTALHAGDIVALYYDPAIMDLHPPTAHCIADYEDYSIWYKPAGLLTQGTRYGDHCALLRQVALHFGLKRPVLPVHRLDREAAGLLMVAHTRFAAAKLSAMLHNHAVDKGYRVWVLGDLRHRPPPAIIDHDLDGKTARTEFSVLRYNADENRTLAQVDLKTGRYHQIRRHFAALGHPVLGDPRYGRNNPHPQGLQLVADSLAFDCPFGRGRIRAAIDADGFDP